MYKLLKLKLAASDGPKNTSPLPPTCPPAETPTHHPKKRTEK